MSDKRLQPGLWTERPVAETQDVYTKWAGTYDAEVGGGGYQTPARIAAALRDQVAPDALILDYGCGTGLSGAALAEAGFTRLHGTDINAAMLDAAAIKGLYEKLWTADPGTLDIREGTYDAIVAAGVVSLGAAPPETLSLLIDKLTPGQILALSFNDPTIAHGGYDTALDSEAPRVETLFRKHGPHLASADMGSDVIVLRRR
ncbi:MAG: class I SAM-dependent DNA methyltransferase [Shimia sp.]